MKRSSLNFCMLVAFSLPALLQGCATLNSKELTRDRARQLIAADKKFTDPYLITLEGSEKYPVPAESADEEPPDARAVELFYQDYPLTAALHRFGLVEVKATAQKRPEVVPFGEQRLTHWIYKVDSRLTAKGSEWAGSRRTDSLPLYKKEITEVTGVTVGQSGNAQAEFKWKRVPTRFGEALDLEGAMFQSLPAQIQSGIKRSISRFGNALPTSYKVTNNGQAEFQLFDDGWRLEYIR